MAMSASSLPRGQGTTIRDDRYVTRLLDTLKRDPARDVLYWQGERITAGEFLKSILDTVATLSGAGVAAATTVAILTEPNAPAMLGIRYGAHLLGAAIVHIRSMNARSDVDSLSWHAQIQILLDTGARILVVDTANLERGRVLAENVSGLTVLDAGDLTRSNAKLPPFAPYTPGDLAVVDLTSGSTNSPKLVRQSFGTREARIRVSAGGPARGHRVILLSVTPISHATGTMVDAVLVDGGAVVLHAEFDVEDFLLALRHQRVTDVYLAVPHLYQLLDHPGIATADLSSLRQVVYSGTAAAPSRIARAVAIFGDALAQLYGSTEAGGISTLSWLDHCESELLGTVGRPFPWVRLEIRHLESDVAVERGELGEICVCSPTLMDGYLGEPDLSEMVVRQGWMRTGDLGFWDRYGYLHLVSRIGSVVKSHGLKLYPSVIERSLLSHPSVANAAVYHVRDGEYVEHVHAAVQPREGATCATADLRTHIAGSLSPAHVPAEITLWEEIPLNESGKPDYAFLRARKDGL